MTTPLSFERDAYETLDTIPLDVRRKLDLCGVKIALAGWRALPEGDRRALRDLDVLDAPSVSAFAASLRAAAERAGVSLDPLPAKGPPPWRSADVPGPVRARAAELGAAVEAAAWRALDDGARYALLKLAEKRREPERFAAALAELIDPRAEG